MHCTVVLLLALVGVSVAAPSADVVTIPITGTVVASRNVSHVYGNVPVRLYNSDASNNKLDLVDTTTTTPEGRFTFDVAHSSRYQVCAFVDGFEACVHHNVPAESDNTGTAGGRERRLTSLSSLSVPVPTFLGPNDYELQTIWTMDNPTYQCDWDTALQTSYASNCLAADKDTTSYGWCCDPNTQDCERNALVYQDANCGSSSWGFEAIGFTEPGTNTYKHFVYGWGTGSSFDTQGALSQGQINLYRRGSSGTPYLEKTILLSGATFSNTNGRFWHTITVSTSNGAFSSTTTVNQVTCTPQLSTGSTTTLSMEHGARGC